MMKSSLLIIFLICFTSTVSAEKVIHISAVDGSSDSVAALSVVREAYNRLGYEIDIHWYKGVEALNKSNSGDTDAELQRIDGLSKKFPNLIQISIPINFLQGSVFTVGQSIEILSWHSLEPYKIGIVDGIIFAKQGTAGMDVKVAKSYPELFSFLKTGQVDVAVMPRINGLHKIKKNKEYDIKEVDGVLETLFLYHYVHKKHRHLVPLLEKTFKEMLLDGTTRSLRNSAYNKILAKE